MTNYYRMFTRLPFVCLMQRYGNILEYASFLAKKFAKISEKVRNVYKITKNRLKSKISLQII